MRGVLKSCLFAIISVIALAKCDKIQVSIPDGVLEGSIAKDYDGGKYYGFKRIPYAKPPVGVYRFEPSQKNDPWEGILDATRDMPPCMQPNARKKKEIGQEDCLYLNVFTTSLKGAVLKPVMVFIHGGQFIQGTGSEFNPNFLITEKIVLIAINYRLGIYGFINTVNSDIATKEEMFGNNGFKDQVLAMKWIRSNIGYFGGDPNRVTIVGHSAGGIAVHSHVLSPLSAGLFQRAIVMSGAATVVQSLTKNNTALSIATYLGLNITNYTSMMNNLRHASNADLFKAVNAMKWFEMKLDEANPLGLVIEKPSKNSFMSHYPIELIKTGKYAKIPLMIGHSNREGLLMLILLRTENSLSDLKQHIPFFFTDKQEAFNKVKSYYNVTTIITDSTIDMYTNIWVKYNVYRTALEHARLQINDIYYYEFAVDAGLNYLKKNNPVIADFYGACHADELGYLFHFSDMPIKGSLEEKIIRNIVKIWANFVKTGKPMENLKPVQVDKFNFVNITNDGLEIGELQEKSFQFWDNMYKVHGNPFY